MSKYAVRVGGVVVLETDDFAEADAEIDRALKERGRRKTPLIELVIPRERRP